MKIEKSPFIVPQAPVETGARIYSCTHFYKSSLTSPSAPTWPGKIGQFFEWLWSKIHFLFTWCLPKKAPPQAPESSQDVRETIWRAQQKKLANPSYFSQAKAVIEQTGKEALIPGGIYLFQNLSRYLWQYLWHRKKDARVFSTDATMISAFVCQKALNVASWTFEKTIRLAFPKSSPHWTKGAGLLMAAPIIWITANDLGYPQGWMFGIGIASSIFNNVQQGLAAQAQAQKAQRLRSLNA